MGVGEHHDALEVGLTVWVADAVHPDPASYLDVDDVLTQMGERAADDYGEAAEGFPDVSGDARQELAGFLKA